MAGRRSPSRVCFCFVTTLFFFSIFPALWISQALRISAANRGPASTFNYVPFDQGLERRRIYVDAMLTSVDFPGMTMAVEWSVAIDHNSDYASSDAYDNNNISINPTLVSSGYYIGKNGLWKAQTRQSPVRTDMHVFTSYSYAPGLKGYHCSGLLCYPFDRYRAYTSFFGREVLTNRAAPLGIMTKSGSVVGLEMTIPRIRDDEATVIVQRTTIVVAYCLILIITFWLITLMITLLTITTVVFRFRQKNEIVVVPIGTVFAGIQLRSSMPGVPEGFGCILDILGLLPCLVLLSISAIAMISIYIFVDPDDPSRRALTWSELENTLHQRVQYAWNTAVEWVQRIWFRILITRKLRRALEIPAVDIARQTRV
ncbi:hypothetical protein IW261DRAFT_1573394 [Armillaria novae-zelandiae]|uniref:Uncharacterized protein n=1 Tax=Armillaria novae-zelandiae TaxID=153914 RepID=A0AA39NNR3_9AGAR|nr:hypothetical protein IW261DRAFT_1573394 [Armillaria novae-zelandiae]